MSILSEFIKDSVDWVEEQLEATHNWARTLVTGTVKEVIKKFRLKWQEKANEWLNEAEDAVRDEGIQMLRDHFPEFGDVPDAKIEQLVKRIMWLPLNYIKEKYNADWLEDT